MTNASPESLCNQIYKRYVKYEETEMAKNMKISRDFVNGFKRFLASESVSVGLLEQGSSFEGIKVGRPDEFDFILVVDCGNRVTPAEARNVGGHFQRDQLAGYWRLQTGDSALQPYCADGALSTAKYKKKFQTLVNRYIEQVRAGRYVQGIRASDQGYASIGNPALTLQVSKAGGSQISIDMSICIKVTGWFSSDRYYIAKRHASEESENFWLVMNSHKELNAFLGMDDQIKFEYRIVKYLLQNHVESSYILKTSFLHLYNKYSNSALTSEFTLLTKMIEFLRDHYQEEKLTTYHNSAENLFARYGSNSLRGHGGYFRRLANKPVEDVVDELYKGRVRSQAAIEEIQTAAKQEDAERGSWCRIL